MFFDMMALGIRDVVADSYEVLLAKIGRICMLVMCFQVPHFNLDIKSGMDGVIPPG